MKTTYAYLIEHMNEPTFSKVRGIARDFVQKLPSELVDDLHNKLNRGADILDSEPLMQMYLYSYGCMHSEKLAFAFQNIKDYIKTAEIIDLIDYGCGQGLATMCYHDFIKKIHPQQQIRSIILIEPSSAALERAQLLCSRFFPNAAITAIQKTFDELLVEDLQINGDIPTLHMFSNILDVESYNVTHLSDIVKSSCRGDNEFVIVSPLQNERKVGKLIEFVENLGVNCYFEKYLDRYQLREDKDWTCSVLLCSTRNKKSASLNLKEVYKNVNKLFDDILLRRDNDFSRKVFEDVKLCADNGDTKCMYTIGRFYCSGTVVEKDYAKALQWYTMASERGYLPAFYDIALIYAIGNGVKKNQEKAIEIANELQNNSPALYYTSLGMIYKVDNNDDLAFEYFKKAAELGNSVSEFHYGAFLYDGKGCKKDKKLGFKHIWNASDKGVASAIFWMARLYENGSEDVNVKQSDILAFKYYNIAARKGVAKAQLKLAKIYKEGQLGVNINTKESFKWYLLLAEKGNTNAAFNVAYAYANGKGVDCDYVEAVKWYNIAADKGSAAALNNLAVCYEHGNGVEKDLERAFSLYQKSALAGNIVAANNLSTCYLKGIGTIENPEKAFLWGKKVANSDNTRAQLSISEWYFKGYGIERNHEKALYWYVKSKLKKEDSSGINDIDDVLIYIKKKANEKNALFQYLLAKCYEYGVGVKINKSEAYLWFESSAKIGFIESSIKLRRIDSLSTKVTKQELAKGIEDEYGVTYSHDWKKVLSCENCNRKSYIIRKGTRIIADGAFCNLNIDEITIPSSVVLIGKSAFAHCPIKSIDIPKGVQSIGESSFSGCSHLEKVWSLGSIEKLASNIFEGCNIKFIHLPSSLKKIGNNAFNGNGELKSIKLPDSVEDIGDFAFAFCGSLEYVNLGESILRIGDFCFSNCSIKEIKMPSSLIHLGIRPFDSADIIANDNSFFTKENGMLVNQKTRQLIWYFGKDSSLTLKGIKSISPLAFWRTEVERIYIPESIKTIPKYAFYGAEKLMSVNLPKSLQRIEKGAFAFCENIRGISIPKSVKDVQESSFAGCKSLNTIRFEGDNTKVSESIINDVGIGREIFPKEYGYVGCFLPFIQDVDIETLETIKIIVPPSTKHHYVFKPVTYNNMLRRFITMESDEKNNSADAPNINGTSPAEQ